MYTILPKVLGHPLLMKGLTTLVISRELWASNFIATVWTGPLWGHFLVRARFRVKGTDNTVCRVKPLCLWSDRVCVCVCVCVFSACKALF